MPPPELFFLKPHMEGAYIFEGKQWYTGFVGKDNQWYTGFVGKDNQWITDIGMSGRNMDARILCFYSVMVNTPAMALEIPGVGFNYAFSAADKAGNYLDGGNNYKVILLVDAPAKDFWSVVVYGPQTRSELQIIWRHSLPQ
jgi:hypothetical protein